MRIEVIQTYKNIHTWTGIIAGLFLYIAFVAGALTMFKTPLNQWAIQSETALPAIELEQYDALIQKVLAKHPEAGEDMMVYLPASYPKNAPVSWIIEDHDTHAVTQWHASLDANGELISEQLTVSAVGDFIDHIHRTAGIPGGKGHDAIGTFVLGVVAALYFVALVSGLIIFLPTWFSDFLSFRKGENRKRYWLDFHNVISITSLPFHLVIALTSFAFAYHDPVYATMQGLVYGDTPMFERPEPSKVQAFTELASIEKVASEINALEPTFAVTELQYTALASPRAAVLVAGSMPGQLVRGASYNYVFSKPYSGEVGYPDLLPSQSSIYTKSVMSFFALHFGNFGGETVRWMYFLLAATGALVFLTGNILWIESRRKRNKAKLEDFQQTRSSTNMAKLTIGVSMGTIIGLGLALITAKLLPHKQYDIDFYQTLAYYIGFLLPIAWAFWQKPIIAAKQLLLVSSLLALCIPVTSFLQAGPASSWGINLAAIIIAAGFITTFVAINRRKDLIVKDSVWAF